MHFYDGFRISHEVNKIEQLTDDDVRSMIDMKMVQAHRRPGPQSRAARAPRHRPEPRRFFQAREACNPFYLACAGHRAEDDGQVRPACSAGSTTCSITSGAPDAERVIVTMGSGCGVVEETVEKLVAEGQKVGLVKVRLYRPFDVKAFVPRCPRRSSDRRHWTAPRSRGPWASRSTRT